MVHQEAGATDVRLVQATSGTWYDTSHTSWETDQSLLSRIMVAGGGGGANTRGSSEEEVYFGYGSGGAGGGLVGGSGTTEGQMGWGLEYPHSYGTGGTQTNGGNVRIFKNEMVILEKITGKFGSAIYEENYIVIDGRNHALQAGGGRRILWRKFCTTWRRRPEALRILADIQDVQTTLADINLQMEL